MHLTGGCLLRERLFKSLSWSATTAKRFNHHSTASRRILYGNPGVLSIFEWASKLKHNSFTCMTQKGVLLDRLHNLWWKWIVRVIHIVPIPCVEVVLDVHAYLQRMAQMSNTHSVHSPDCPICLID
eukprot:4849056-Amphidinium_carterae.1